MFRTRLPVASGIATLLPLDLHVLSLPLAFRIKLSIVNELFDLTNQR